MYWDMQVAGTHNYVTADGYTHHNSGKSVGCCLETYFRAFRQEPHKRTKKRRSRWAFVRNTAQQLRDTTLATWMEWFPEGPNGRFKTSDMIYEYRQDDIELDILFRALDRPDDIRRLLSLELTGAWINEAREVPWQIVDGLTGRVGRYPPRQEEGCSWSGIIMDTNPPDEDHWWHAIFEEGRPPNVGADVVTEADRKNIRRVYKGFRQPPGVVRVNNEWQLNLGQVAGIPAAENVENLPQGYYDKYVVGKGPDTIKVYAEGKYGITTDGRPVFPAYDDDLHCPKDLDGMPVEIPYDPRLPLIAGMDSSVTGQALLIGQISPRGQLRLLQEVVSDGAGLEDFVEHGVKPALSRFPKAEWRDCWFDPAANKRTDIDEREALIYLNDGYEDTAPKLPFDTVTAPTNSIQPRIGAVNHFLTRLIPKDLTDKSAPALLVDGVHCPRLRKGFQGKYEFKRVQISGEDRFKDLPNKNRYSHIHDACQYLALGARQDHEEDLDVPPATYQPQSRFSGY